MSKTYQESIVSVSISPIEWFCLTLRTKLYRILLLGHWRTWQTMSSVPHQLHVKLRVLKGRNFLVQNWQIKLILAIRTLHAAQRHYKEAIAVTIAMIGLQSVIEPDSAHADMHQIEQPVGGLYQAYLPIAGKGADFRIVLPGHAPPLLSPLNPALSPTARPSEPKPTATEVPATTTPENHMLKGSRSRKHSLLLIPYWSVLHSSSSLKIAVSQALPDNLITFDAEPEGTGAISQPMELLPTYRLLLKDEQKPDENIS